MKRREFLTKAGIGALAAGSLLAGCGKQDGKAANVTPSTAKAETIQWKMVTSWPKNFPGLGTGADFLANTINELSGGRLQVKVFAAGELVPPFEIFDAVAQGTAEMGHSAAYYWKGKVEAAQFFTSVPFGMTAQETNAWLHHGGGLDLWRELYQPFGLLPFAVGNTGVQMGGWFNREITTLDDLKGLKMRTPGFGAEVLKRAGGTPVNLPGSEIFTALQTGAIDAVEWVGPYNDLAFGLHRAAKFYYWPGWQETSAVLEGLVNKKAFDTLPKELQAVVEAACRIANEEMLDEYTARSFEALDKLTGEHKVELRRYPDAVLEGLRGLAGEVIAELTGRDEKARKVHASYAAFQKRVASWHAIGEAAVYGMRKAG